MTKLPLVSVIITCYNIRDYITDAISSVKNQTYTNVEIIVVDDGSTDGTGELLRTCYPDVLYLVKINGGPSSARNLGILHSHGELVAFLDGDDLWEPEKLEQQVAILSEHSGLGILFSDFSTFNESGTVATAKNKSLFRHLAYLDYEFLVNRNNFIYPSTVLVRKSVLLHVGGFDESLCGPEDWELWLRIARYTGIAGVHSPLTHIRQHGSNISSNVVLMFENEKMAIEKQQVYITAGLLRKRMARLYLLNADRCIHNDQRYQAIILFFKGLCSYPFHVIPICIVFLKIIIGKKTVNIVRQLVDNNRLLRYGFEIFYRHY